MKIEIFITDTINENTTGMTCFEAEPVIAKMIAPERPIKGLIIIDGKTSKFAFSPMSMDGDIFCEDDTQRTMIKYLIPLYVYNTRCYALAHLV